MELEAPSMYYTGGKRPALLYRVGPKWVEWLGFYAGELTTTRCRKTEFIRAFFPLEYTVKKAVENFTEFSKRNERFTSERALAVLKKLSKECITEEKEIEMAEIQQVKPTPKIAPKVSSKEEKKAKKTPTAVAPKAKIAVPNTPALAPRTPVAAKVALPNTPALAPKTPVIAKEAVPKTPALAPKIPVIAKEAGRLSSGDPVGRLSLFKGNQKIIVLSKQNPKRPGSGAHERFELYKKSKTIEEYLANGGTMADIRWDTKQQFIELK